MTSLNRLSFPRLHPERISKFTSFVACTDLSSSPPPSLPLFLHAATWTRFLLPFRSFLSSPFDKGRHRCCGKGHKNRKKRKPLNVHWRRPLPFLLWIYKIWIWPLVSLSRLLWLLSPFNCSQPLCVILSSPSQLVGFVMISSGSSSSGERTKTKEKKEIDGTRLNPKAFLFWLLATSEWSPVPAAIVDYGDCLVTVATLRLDLRSAMCVCGSCCESVDLTNERTRKSFGRFRKKRSEYTGYDHRFRWSNGWKELAISFDDIFDAHTHIAHPSLQRILIRR